MSKKGQEEGEQGAMDGRISCWHGICLPIETMKTGVSLFWRKRAQVIVSALLILGITVAIITPQRTAGASRASRKTFSVTEPDLATPVFSSPCMVQHLNAVLHDYAEFAGYDQFLVRLETGGSVEVVSTVKYSGALFPLLGIELLKAERSAAEHVFISESLWERSFSRDPQTVGQLIRINGQEYLIAGITRAHASPLAETEIWMPIRSRSSSGNLPSMRVIGAVKNRGDWISRAGKLAEFVKTAISLQGDPEDKSRVIRLVPFEFDVELSSAIGRNRVTSRRA
ncbi:MAG TPA: ABC transporter permease [Verrucomicrobiae bacterium]|nr:ABC transporter permease [Verrucomicrobiae bacterium]